jgi:hypothetical protein
MSPRISPGGGPFCRREMRRLAAIELKKVKKVVLMHP